MASVFCGVAAGSEPAFVVYEDDATVAFLNRTQLARRHTLVVPRAHYRDLLDAPARALT